VSVCYHPVVGIEKDFNMSLRRAAAASISLLLCLSACGGDASSPYIPDTPANVPVSMEWFEDDGTVWQKADFTYDNDGFQSIARRPGEDGIWETGDDRSALLLECRYAAAQDKIPVRGLIFARAVGRSATGRLALEVMGYAGDGTVLKRCPIRPGLWRVKERFKNIVFTLTRSRNAQTITETQEMLWLMPQTVSEPMLVSQTASILLDDRNRPMSVSLDSSHPVYDELLIENCVNGGNFAFEIILQISCSAMKQSQRFFYDGSRTTRETDFYNAVSYDQTRTLHRVVDKQNRVVHTSYSEQYPPGDWETPILSYHYDGRDRIVRIMERTPGADRAWFTEDDLVQLEAQYLYENGRPFRFVNYDARESIRFYYGGNGKIERAEFHRTNQDTPQAIRYYDYQGDRLVATSLYTRPENDDTAALTKLRAIQYGRAARGYPAAFVPEQAKETWPPTVESITNQFYADVPWPAGR
jgi:hypothetical protein